MPSPDYWRKVGRPTFCCTHNVLRHGPKFTQRSGVNFGLALLADVLGLLLSSSLGGTRLQLISKVTYDVFGIFMIPGST